MDWSLRSFSEQVTRVLAPWAVAASALFFGGCAGRSGAESQPFQGFVQSEATQINETIKAYGPGYAVVDRVVPDPVAAAIQNLVANTGGRNHEAVVLYQMANGTWERHHVHVATGDLRIEQNVQPTNKEIALYFSQLPGTQVSLLDYQPSRLLQDQINTYYARNRAISPSIDIVIDVEQSTGRPIGMRLPTDKERTEARVRPNWGQLPTPFNVQFPTNYSPWELVGGERSLWRSQLRSGTPPVMIQRGNQR